MRTALLAVEAIPTFSPSEWRDEMTIRLQRGAHILTVYGRADSEHTANVIVTAVIEVAPRELHMLRTSIPKDTGYHSLTPDYPSMHCFERELHEQHGLRIKGHPWLKPVRFENSPGGKDTYPYYEITGKEVHEVAVGPIHAGVIEPGSFRFMCLGEVVHHLEIRLGYQHRGVERLLRSGDPRALGPLVETIAGDTSIAHTWAYCAAIEALSNVVVTPKAEAARGLMLELERIAMHLASLAGLAGDVGFLQGNTTYGRLRTTAINTSMRLCGSRFGRGALRPGGSGVCLVADEVGAPPAGKQLSRAELHRNLDLLESDGRLMDTCFLDSRTVAHRLGGVGIVEHEEAREIGLVGLVARASGTRRDLREGAPGVYEDTPIRTCVEATGDCLGRARMRIEEIRQSLAWIRSVVESCGTLEPVRADVEPLAANHLAIGAIEGWRGEVVHVLETDRTGALLHYKVQDPSFRNWYGLALAVRENEISDFPICNKSFDLSYCGHDL